MEHPVQHHRWKVLFAVNYFGHVSAVGSLWGNRDTYQQWCALCRKLANGRFYWCWMGTFYQPWSTLLPILEHVFANLGVRFYEYWINSEHERTRVAETGWPREWPDHGWRFVWGMTSAWTQNGQLMPTNGKKSMSECEMFKITATICKSLIKILHFALNFLILHTNMFCILEIKFSEWYAEHKQIKFESLLPNSIP